MGMDIVVPGRLHWFFRLSNLQQYTTNPSFLDKRNMQNPDQSVPLRQSRVAPILQREISVQHDVIGVACAELAPTAPRRARWWGPCTECPASTTTCLTVPPPPLSILPYMQNTELCGDDHAPVTRGRMRAQYPLPHGPLCISYALVQATVGVGTVIILYVI